MQKMNYDFRVQRKPRNLVPLLVSIGVSWLIVLSISTIIWVLIDLAIN